MCSAHCLINSAALPASSDCHSRPHGQGSAQEEVNTSCVETGPKSQEAEWLVRRVVAARPQMLFCRL